MGKDSEVRSPQSRSRRSDRENGRESSGPKITQATNATTPSITASEVAKNVMVAKDALEKARKAELVQKQIQEHLQKINFTKKLIPATSTLGVKNLLFDSLGRVVDQAGNLVRSTPIIYSTLKVNRNLEVEKQRKEMQMEKSEKIAKRVQQTQYNDPSLNNLKRKKRKQFKFVEPGTYIKQERQLLRQMEDKASGINRSSLMIQKKKLLELQNQRLNTLYKLQQSKPEGEKDQDKEEDLEPEVKEKEKVDEQAETADQKEEEKEKEKEINLQDINPNLIPLRNNRLEKKDSWDDDEPFLEWWDRGVIYLKSGEDPFKLQNLKKHQYITNVNLDDLQINEERLNNYIEHPVKLDGKRKKGSNLGLIQLTKKERRKLKRLRKQERQKIIRDKIIIGIIPPPPPKLKLSNLINVLKNQSAADPSKVEHQVRQQMEQRLRAHEQRNEERKLTKEQRSKKNAQKWQIKKNAEAEAALFTINSLSNPKLLRKIDTNAQQYHLSGTCIIMNTGPAFLVVEGSKLSIRRYTKLLLRRIKWTEYPLEDELDASQNNCKQVWVGNVKKRSFPHWTVNYVDCDEQIEDILRPYKAVHYFEMVQKYRDPLEDLQCYALKKFGFELSVLEIPDSNSGALTHLGTHPYLDSTWDHPENEDKHLISQVARISNYADTVSLTTNNESRSLDGEYGRQLASVVVSSSNKLNIKYYVDTNIYPDLNLYYLSSDILKSNYPEYHTIVTKIISDIQTPLSLYTNILSCILCNASDVASYIPETLSILQCVLSQICNIANCLQCYITLVKSSFKCYISKLTLDIQCIIEISKSGKYIQNLNISIETCTTEFEKKINEEITKLKAICFYTNTLISIQDNLNKLIKLLTSNNEKLSNIKSSISINNVDDIIAYINLNPEIVALIEYEIESLIYHVHYYGSYFNSICSCICSLKTNFGEGVKKLQTSVDIKIKECQCELKCDLTKMNIEFKCKVPDSSKVTCAIDSLISIVQEHECDLHMYDCEIAQDLSCINCDCDYLKHYCCKISDQIRKNGYLNKVFFKCSFRSISSNLIHSNTTYQNKSIVIKPGLEAQNVSLNILSLIATNESFFVISKIYFYYKIKFEIPKMLSILEHCICIKVFEKYYLGTVCSYHRPLDFSYIHSINWYVIHNDIHNKENYSCLCKIIRYRLIPELLLISSNSYIYLDILTTVSRKFEKYLPYSNDKLLMYKSIILAIQVIYKIALWMRLKYSDDVRRGYCFCNKYDDNFIYVKLTIIRICELIENCFTIQYESIINEINFLSSLLSEYQSIHVYSNYYSSFNNNVSPIFMSRLMSMKLAKLSGSISTIVVNKDNPSLVESNMASISTTAESNEKSSTTTYAITTASTQLLSSSVKGGFMALKSMILGTHFSKEGFGLIYSKFISMSFSIHNSGIITKATFTKSIKKPGIKLSLKFLENICKPGQQTCDCRFTNKQCKICPIGKTRIISLSISLKRIQFVISNVAGDMLLYYLKGSISTSKDFFSNLCVGFGEVYTAMTKNSYSTHFNSSIDNKNIANRFPSPTVGSYL